MQLIGSLSCIVVVSIASYVLFKVLRSLPGSWNLRLEEDLELEGIDIAEHGQSAYHTEFGVGMRYTSAPSIGGNGTAEPEPEAPTEPEPAETVS